MPNPVSRADIVVCEGATLHVDETRPEGRHAAALLFAWKQGDEDDVDAIDPTTLHIYMEEAKAMGLCLPKPAPIRIFPDLPAEAA